MPPPSRGHELSLCLQVLPARLNGTALTSQASCQRHHDFAHCPPTPLHCGCVNICLHQPLRVPPVLPVCTACLYRLQVTYFYRLQDLPEEVLDDVDSVTLLENSLVTLGIADSQAAAKELVARRGRLGGSSITARMLHRYVRVRVTTLRTLSPAWAIASVLQRLRCSACFKREVTGSAFYRECVLLPWQTGLDFGNVHSMGLSGAAITFRLQCGLRCVDCTAR